jgi:hypothetical protein
LRKDTVFFRQVELLLRVLPLVNQEEVFALKGGTAINFFLRDLPRQRFDVLKILQGSVFWTEKKKANWPFSASSPFPRFQ